MSVGVEISNWLGEGAIDLPTSYGQFSMRVMTDLGDGREHVAIGTPRGPEPGEAVLVRIHSECLTGDVFGSLLCDCGPQLHAALERVAQAPAGLVLYLRQEGRGIGLVNKIRAYGLQELGADTVEANHQLGFADDVRDYALCSPLLRYFDIQSLRLLTNNPRKITALEELGIHVERVEHVVGSTRFNSHYLATKAHKLGHLLPQGSVPSQEAIQKQAVSAITKK
jgi:GTP cyclohydrolase II